MPVLYADADASEQRCIKHQRGRNPAEEENIIPAEYTSIQMNYNSQLAVTLTHACTHIHKCTQLLASCQSSPSIRLFLPPFAQLIKQKCKHFNWMSNRTLTARSYVNECGSALKLHVPRLQRYTHVSVSKLQSVNELQMFQLNYRHLGAN